MIQPHIEQQLIRRKTIFRILLLGGSSIGITVATAMFGELAARLKLKRTAEKNPYVIAANERENAGIDQQAETIWEVPWRTYRKNASVSYVHQGRQTLFATNSRGFRTADYTIPKPPGTIRIVCIGGSTTAEGSTNNSTYPAILETQLRKNLSTDQIEVVNCGISGLNSPGQIKKLPNYLEYKPDVIIDYFGVNDICWRLIRLWKLSAVRVPGWLTQSTFITENFNRLYAPSPERISTDLHVTTLRNFRIVAEKIRQNETLFLACTFAFPNLSDCDAEERDFFNHNLKTFWRAPHLTIESYCQIMRVFNENLKQVCASMDIPVIPISDELKGGADTFNDICHLNEDGIRRKAEIIASYMTGYISNRLAEHRPPISGNHRDD